MDDIKTTQIQIRIEQSLKDAFYKKCEENMQTPSLVLRKMIEDFIKK